MTLLFHTYKYCHVSDFVWLIIMGSGFVDWIYWSPLLQLQFFITADKLNSFWTTSVWRISLKNLSLISVWSLLLEFEPNLVESMLRPTVSQPVFLGIKHPSWAYNQIVITVRQLRVCWCGALSLTRGRVYRLQLLLALASAVILEFQSLGTRDHILVSQIWDFPFCRLLRLVRLRWRYSTPPPHGILLELTNTLPVITATRTG
jgi:hypothetical protein